MRCKRLPTHIYTIVLGVCRAYEASERTGTSLPARLRDMKWAVEAAAARVMLGEERVIPHMIRAIARLTPYSRASSEILLVYSEATYHRRKRQLMHVIAKELGLM